MRACSTGVFGSCLLLCAPTIGAVRGGGVKNCAPPLESEHESSLLKNLSPWRECRDSVFYHESAEAGMRGAFVDQGGLFSYIAPEARVPANHPLRKIRELVRDVLGELTP